jgi:hypothetical protein
MKKILAAILLLCSFEMSKSEAAWTNSGTYSSNGGALMIPFENKVTGIMNISNTKVLSLINAGTVSCKNCIFTKEVLNRGVLSAEKTQFQGVLSVAGGQTQLTSCELTDLKILDLDSTPVVQIDGDTHIHGSVVFETGKGQVMIGPFVTIEGAIIGGTVVSE